MVPLVIVVAIGSCADRPAESTPLTALLPLRLEDHLETARVAGSARPTSDRQPLEWQFDTAQPDWSVVPPLDPQRPPALPEQSEEGLRLLLERGDNTLPRTSLIGAVVTALPPAWQPADWSHVEVRARASGQIRDLMVRINLSPGEAESFDFPFFTRGDATPVVSDGTTQTYELALDVLEREIDGPWTHLGLSFATERGAAEGWLEITSVRVIPREARYAHAGVGVLTDWRQETGSSARDSPHRRVLFTHTPGELTYDIVVPEGARLDVGLGIVDGSNPVTFEVVASSDDGEPLVLLRESVTGEHWAQRSIDLNSLADRRVALTLRAESPEEGAVALWANPTVSAARATDMPNVVFYVIDGGSPDNMSAYGYNRRTTPNLERLAAQGALFESVYSNSSWTRPSTASFVTSLQHSVLGGLRNGLNPVPGNVLTIAEHMRGAGYQTALFTNNPNAGRISAIDRGTDFSRDAGTENFSTSSVNLHANFWGWRRDYPAEPYWVHFQTTDVHYPHDPVPPFAGLFIDPERSRWVKDMTDRADAGGGFLPSIFGLVDDPADYWSGARDLYDEAMAHQDYQIGKLVDGLRARGEWDNTLLIIAADHGIDAGAWDYDLLMREIGEGELGYTMPRPPILRPGTSRVPLIVVWPGHIEPGRRIDEQVSMIDVLPTVLDLVGLPLPEIMMGQSLAPLLLGTPGWEPRPVILDEFELDDATGELHGLIEIVDGRWGASLHVGWNPEAGRRRPAPLVLYDLWSDPDAVRSLHEERPDLVEKYRALLEERWAAHQALAQLVTRGTALPLDSEQTQSLRALGYIR